MSDSFKSQLSALNVSTLAKLLDKHPWTHELAGILLLSALIDFIDIPRKLHVFELVGAVPLWSWPVTPAGYRLLLSDKHFEEPCCLDRVGSSVQLICIDGRYGDSYPSNSPETVRMCVSAQKVSETIENTNNITKKKDDEEGDRVQKLEIVRISRKELKHKSSQSWWIYVLFDYWKARSPRYLAVSTAGWILWLVVSVGSFLRGSYLAFVFLMLMPGTGLLVFLVHGCKPRQLLVEKGSKYNRLVVATADVNGRDWKVFYGESTIVNSFLNRPLFHEKPINSPVIRRLLRILLRLCIPSQWVIAVGAACLKEWNAIIIFFWIMLCIFSNSFAYTAEHGVKDWLEYSIYLDLKLYEVVLSSRRALLNTILALNPDLYDKENDRSAFRKEAMKWLDTILAEGKERSAWETATLSRMKEPPEEVAEDVQQKYWYKYIGEGIDMGKSVTEIANLAKLVE